MCPSGAMCPGGIQLWGTIVGEGLPSSWDVGLSLEAERIPPLWSRALQKNVKSWARTHTSWECLSVVFILNLSHCISGSLCAELLWGLQGGKLPVGTDLVLAVSWFQFVRLCCTVYDFDLISYDFDLIRILHFLVLIVISSRSYFRRNNIWGRDSYSF